MKSSGITAINQHKIKYPLSSVPGSVLLVVSSFRNEIIFFLRVLKTFLYVIHLSFEDYFQGLEVVP